MTRSESCLRFLLASSIWTFLVLCHAPDCDAQDVGDTKTQAPAQSSPPATSASKTVESEIVAPGGGAAEGVVEPIQIGDRRELFVDDLLIEELSGTWIKLHRPVRLRNISPRPSGHYATVLSDGDRLRLYYRGDKVPGAHWRNGWENYHLGEVTLYAESLDRGRTWKKPDLGVLDLPQFPDGNAILEANTDNFWAPHNFTPMIDTRPGVPGSERYKALGGMRVPDANWHEWRTPDEHAGITDRYGAPGLKAYASPDGIHWKLMQKEPVIGDQWGAFDSQNVAFWSEAEQSYVCYFRWINGGLRSIRRSTSKDFLVWSEPTDMIANEPKEHLYTNGTQPYFRAPHLYVALPTRFQATGGSITDIVFMATRPGSDRYHRQFKQAFIRPGIGKRGWGNRANYIAYNLVQTSDFEMSLFMYGGDQYVLRLDGFISIHADYETGEFTSKPLRYLGNALEINYSTSGAGRIKVELLNERGEPIPGYTFDDCDVIQGDSISETVTWKGSEAIKPLGNPVRLRFRMNEADLYSIRFHQVEDDRLLKETTEAETEATRTETTRTETTRTEAGTKPAP